MVLSDIFALISVKTSFTSCCLLCRPAVVTYIKIIILPFVKVSWIFIRNDFIYNGICFA